eukprot:TRINITY_DN65940_c10_g5_i1.p1 TRINITY_DN65940_c10_g5~~TRINITY_DN65940_c10_g5_i1.p1  ORF type:complete len:176 (+),score=95.44 TRINITY_DN65940_c10_g5_i1:71-529(+)
MSQQQQQQQESSSSSSSSSKPKRQLRKAVFVKVATIEPGSHGHNVTVLVDSVNVVMERKRHDATMLTIAEALVGDETGCILLTLRNEQIAVAQPGTTINIRNCRVEMFQGHMRLSVDKWGVIERASEPATFAINKENDLSQVEYELVVQPDE